MNRPTSTIDEAAVHARDVSTSRPFRTLCGRARDEVRYVAGVGELLTLTTPPAPICPQCRFAIEKDHCPCMANDPGAPLHTTAEHDDANGGILG